MFTATEAPLDLRTAPDWVSASQLRNYCLDDPILDWLDHYGVAKGFTRDGDQSTYDQRTDFLQFIGQQGQRFEQAVVEHLSSRVPITTIATTWVDIQCRTSVEATLKAMRSGSPVISQAVLWNPLTCTFGAADLLVRSDVLRSWYPVALTAADAAVGATGIGCDNWHYRVVDIKFTTLKLDKSGHAGGSHLEYMAQVFIYTEALGLMQGYQPPCGYLLGRSWKQRSARGDSCMERLARVDVAYVRPRGKMSLAETVSEGITWVRRLRAQGIDWNALPEPSVEELRPNMSHTEDQPWHAAKREIAHGQGELTLLWQVGADKRRTAVAAGVRRWDEPGLTAAAVGVRHPPTAKVLDRILNVNRDHAGPPVIPARITANEHAWRLVRPMEFYVDFESVSDLKDDFSTLPNRGGVPLIFMIGCGHLEGGEWQFTRFITDALSEVCEAEIIEHWLAHMQAVRERAAPTMVEAPLVIHWSQAETSTFNTAYNSAKARHPDRAWADPNWFDILKEVVKREPVVVRGALGFGLKAMAKALYDHGCISTTWREGPTDGLGAMIGAWWCADEARAKGVPLSELPLMREIADYNEGDCRAMAELLGYIRAHH